MTYRDPERVLRRAGRRDAPRAPHCLDEETVAAFTEGTLDDVTRASALPHLAECPRCRAAIASVSRALSDPSIANEIARLGNRRLGNLRRRRIFQIAIPVAAAAVLLLVVPSDQDDDAPVHRAPTITAVGSPVLTSPVGIVAGAEALRWRSVSGADRYRATLFDNAGAVVFETQTVDTTVALPDSVRLEGGRSYLWKVDARTGWGRWSASELIEFSIR